MTAKCQNRTKATAVLAEEAVLAHKLIITDILFAPV
jgi:hypothetical protein